MEVVDTPMLPWLRRTTLSAETMPHPNLSVDETHQPDLDTCIVGGVAENNPRYLGAAARLVRSIRWFGGRMSHARVMVCVVGEVDARAAKDLARLDAEMAIVEPFDRRNPAANKLRFLELAMATRAEFILLLDCDVILVRDPMPLLDRRYLQARLADLPTVPHRVFRRLFRHFCLPLPPRCHRTTFLGARTILYCNSGVIGLPASLARQLVPIWARYNREILSVMHLMGPSARHCNQASLSLALAAQPVPFQEAPLALNYPLHLTDLQAPAELLASDPAILHYHDRVSADGGLAVSPYPLAQPRIEAFNRRLRDDPEWRALWQP